MSKLTRVQHIRFEEDIYSKVEQYCQSNQISVPDFIRSAVTDKLLQVTTGTPELPTSRQQLRDLAQLLLNSL